MHPDPRWRIGLVGGCRRRPRPRTVMHLILQVGQDAGPIGGHGDVCSKWALGRRSLVSTVQPSLRVRTSLVPRRPSARWPGRCPGSSRMSCFRRALADEVGDLRLLVHVLADAVADELLDDVEPLALDVAFHQAGDFGPVAAAGHGADGQVEGLRGDVEELPDLGADGADGEGHGRVAAPAVELAAGVDRDDVSLLERPAVGDAVHDLLVDAGADDGRERRLPLGRAGIAQEQRDARRARGRWRRRPRSCRRWSRRGRPSGGPGPAPGRRRGPASRISAISRGLLSLITARGSPALASLRLGPGRTERQPDRGIAGPRASGNSRRVTPRVRSLDRRRDGSHVS